MPRKKSGTKAPEAKGSQPKHNEAAVENANRHLFFHHKRRIAKFEEDARLARNALSKAKKLATAELSQFGMSQEDIKESFELDKQGGEQVAMSKIQRQLRIMRWMGFGPGAQGDMFEDGVGREFVDPFERGIIAALNGDLRDSNPYPAEDTQNHLQWEHGFDKGYREHIDWQKTRDTEDFDETPIAGGTQDPEDVPGDGEEDDGGEDVESLSDGPDEGPGEEGQSSVH